jgi:hypothetical protein
VLRTGGLTELETAARAINVEPWEPLPCMVKRQCPEYRYYFAAPVGSGEQRCPDCVAFGTRPRPLEVTQTTPLPTIRVCGHDHTGASLPPRAVQSGLQEPRAKERWSGRRDLIQPQTGGQTCRS